MFVLCDRPGEGSLQKELLMTDVSTTSSESSEKSSSDDGIYASGRAFDWSVLIMRYISSYMKV